MNQSTNQLINRSTNHPLSQSTILWMVSLLTVVFVFSYFNVISLLVKTWLSRDDYSHGFLIPFISFYFIYANREKLKGLSIEPNITGGLTFTLIGSLMLLTGSVSSVVTLQQYSILIIIPGLVLMLLGVRYLKALSLPIAYLIFMIPNLDWLFNKFRLPLQLFSAKIASILLSLFNIPVLHNAQYIELPNITLEVADVCSGLNYLVSIIAIGIPLAYFTQKNWLSRVLLIILALIVGILANPIRVALIGIWAYSGGEGLHGPSHIFRALFVSIIGFVFLFIGAWTLTKIPFLNNKRTPKKVQNKKSDPTINTKKFNKTWLASTVILLSVGSYLHLHNPEPTPLNFSLTQIPLTIGNWKGENVNYPEKIFNIQGADFELNRVYRNTSGREIKLYIGFFESQQQDKELIHYQLQKLYNDTEEIEIHVSSHSPFLVNKTLLKEDAQNSLVLYWYDLNGKIVANRYKAKFTTALQGIIHGQTNGAIIIISSNMKYPDEMNKILNDEIEFVQGIFPVLDNQFPDI